MPSETNGLTRDCVDLDNSSQRVENSEKVPTKLSQHTNRNTLETIARNTALIGLVSLTQYWKKTQYTHTIKEIKFDFNPSYLFLEATNFWNNKKYSLEINPEKRYRKHLLFDNEAAKNSIRFHRDLDRYTSRYNPSQYKWPWRNLHLVSWTITRLLV